MGNSAATKLLQRSINRMQATQINVDGILGDETFISANIHDPMKLREEMRICAREKLLGIVEDNPALEWAKSGWLRRAEW
jgi:lysozyme family protein